MDADGATPITELSTLKDSIKGHASAIACGSRCMASKVKKKCFLRSLLSSLFSLLLWLISYPEVRDSQCGFKLLTREAARQVIPLCCIKGWAFDVELLHWCKKRGVVIKEVPVEWVEKDGSKLCIPTDSVLMMLDVFLIGLNDGIARIV